MVDISYEKLIDKISKTSGLELTEIERRIEAKRAKLSGLISKEGAAQVIAAELGVSFDIFKHQDRTFFQGLLNTGNLQDRTHLFVNMDNSIFAVEIRNCPSHTNRVFFLHFLKSPFL